MDALDILARFDAGQPVTTRELGCLLPELDRRGHLKAERASTTATGSSTAHTATAADSSFGLGRISAITNTGSRKSKQLPWK